MADRSRLPLPPTAYPVANPGTAADGIPTAAPYDDRGALAIPELAGRTPTHNESVLLNGDTIHLGSSNVESIWYFWQEQRLFVQFLSGDLYAYEGVPLSVAVGMVETDSPGRYVWNKLRDVYAYRRLKRGEGARKPPQVVRLVNR